MDKKIGVSFGLLLMIVVGAGFCISRNSSPSKASGDNRSIVVGGDIDSHGCKPSAGYTFSKVRNECLRVFEKGIRLDPNAQIADKTASAFVVIATSSPETRNVEVFVPGATGSSVLAPQKIDKSNPYRYVWKNSDYMVTFWKGIYYLQNAKTEDALFQGPQE